MKSGNGKTTGGTKRHLHVLVVDDSAVVRKLATAILERERTISTSMAANPVVAQRVMNLRRPDVILLDLEMPRMDGLTFLRKIMAEDPIPVIICSALARRGTEAALAALQAGAVDVITKPKMGVAGFLEESATLLVDAVRGAAEARLSHKRPPASSQPVASTKPALSVTTDKVVAIGASTGGTEAIRHILESMPPDCPGIVVVQHMPEYFTAAFAQRINESCSIMVKEAEDGDSLRPGRALVAPGNRHAEVRRSGGFYIVRLSDGPLVSRHRPSVDVLFHSVAKSAGTNAMGVILTGMGADGANGMVAMHNAGAYTVAQDEESCVVFGMPKEAILRGAVDTIHSLETIPGSIIRWSSTPTLRQARSRHRGVMR